MGDENLEKNAESVNKSSYYESLRIFGKLSIYIVTPIIIAVIIGKLLDKKFGTEPKLFLLCILISFMYSIFKLVNETKKYIAEISKNDKVANKEK